MDFRVPLEVVKVGETPNGQFVLYRITHQDETLMPRWRYCNEELNIYSYGSPEYKVDTKRIYLRGSIKCLDNDIIRVNIEDENDFLYRILKLNTLLTKDKPMLNAYLLTMIEAQKEIYETIKQIKLIWEE